MNAILHPERVLESTGDVMEYTIETIHFDKVIVDDRSCKITTTLANMPLQYFQIFLNLCNPYFIINIGMSSMLFAERLHAYLVTIQLPVTINQKGASLRLQTDDKNIFDNLIQLLLTKNTFESNIKKFITDAVGQIESFKDEKNTGMGDPWSGYLKELQQQMQCI